MPAAIVPAIGAAGSVISAVGGKNAQKAAQKAAGQAADGQNQIVGAESGTFDKLLGSFFGPGGAQAGMNSLMQFLGGQVGKEYQNSNATAAQGTASQLSNFKGLKPEETNALQTTLGNAGNSTVNTLMSRLGGSSNPNALAQTLLNQNSENSLNSTVQLGSLGAQQELGALQSAGSLQSNLSEQNLQNRGQTLGGLEGLFGQQSGLLGTALSGMSGIANMYGQAGANAASNAASYGNPFGSALTNIAGFAGNSGLFGGSGGGGGAPASILGNYNPSSTPGPTTYGTTGSGMIQAIPGASS